jgi:hypothetical protein
MAMVDYHFLLHHATQSCETLKIKTEAAPVIV